MGNSMSNHPKKLNWKRYPPPPDFDENVHVWSTWSEKEICHILAYLVKYCANIELYQIIICCIYVVLSCY